MKTMNNTMTKKLAVAVLAVAALSGCATTRTADLRDTPAAAPAAAKVSMPMRSYGSLGGYRYRRFAAVDAPAS